MLTFSSPIIINGGNFLTYGDALLNRQTLYQTPQISQDVQLNPVAVSQDGGVYIALQIIGGEGNFISSSTGMDPVFSLQKLNSNGTLDTNFYNNVLSITALSNLTYRTDFDRIFVQSDGKIIVAGGLALQYRFNTDGTRDSSFARANMTSNTSVYINKVLQQSDGKLILVGGFTSYSGSSSPGIIRINSDNTVDTSFKTGGGFTGSSGIRIYDAKLQSDGKIVCAGIFSFYSGSVKNYGGAIRLNTGGDIDTSFDPGTSFGGTGASLVDDYPTIVQVNSNGSLTFAGNFIKYQNQSGSIIRTLSDGTIDTSFKSGSLSPRTIVQDSFIESNDKIILLGGFTSYSGSSATRIVRINPNGTVDTDFKYGQGFPNGIPYQITQDSSGNFYIAGSFTLYSGSLDGLYDGIVKINNSGSIDTSFSPPGYITTEYVGVFNNYPDSSWWQFFPVKKILSSSLGGYYVMGQFNRIGSDKKSYPGIVKLNSNLTISSSIDYSASFNFDSYQNPYDAVEQSDNKLVLAGNFTSYKGLGTNRIVRINPDFSKDNTFITGSGFNNLVYALAIDSATQKIYAGGDFTSYSGSAVNRIARINTNGTIDTTFSANIGTGFNNTVVKIVPQTDGKILVGGSFSTFNGNSSAGIVRLNSDGTYDTTFKTNGGISLAGVVRDIISQSDGKILFCGNFTTYSGSSYCQDVVRVDSSGSIDTSFNSGTGLNTGYFISAIQAQDGSYILGTSINNDGVSTNYSGSQFQTVYSVGPIKINSDGKLNNSFNCAIFTDSNAYASSIIKSMVFDSDGGLLIGGNFFWVSGSYQYNISKINIENGYPWYTQR